MTATTPLAVAIRDATKGYSRFDKHRDRDVLRRTVTELDIRGHTANEIAVHVGLLQGQVTNILRGRIADHRPAPVNPPDLSDEHCTHLERTADAALKLACRLRDEDPQLTWDALSALNRRDLQKLAVVLLAAVPIDQPKNEIFAWVYQLGGNL